MTNSNDATDTAAMINKVSTQLSTVNDQLKANAEKALADATQFGDMQEKTKNTVDDLLIKHTALEAQLTELEQNGVRVGAHNGARMSAGQMVANSELMKNVNSSNLNGKVVVGVKNALTSLTTDANGSVGDAITPDRQAGIVQGAERRMTIRDLLIPGTTNSGVIEYIKETGFTNNAAVVAEGGAKPETTMKLDLVSENAKTIAHWVHASKQILDDAPQLQSYIDGRLFYGLQLVEENQLLNGSGTSGNISGLVTEATAYSPALTVTNSTAIDTLRLAMLQTTLAEYMSTGFVLNPTDWARIETTKDSDGRYIIGNPQAGTQPTLWGKPVIETQAMAVDTFLTGSFGMAAQIFDKQDATIDISESDQDDFIKNMIKIRAELRLALAIYRPEAFVSGDLGFVTA